MPAVPAPEGFRRALHVVTCHPQCAVTRLCAERYLGGALEIGISNFAAAFFATD